jgi:hypothetical protein
VEHIKTLSTVTQREFFEGIPKEKGGEFVRHFSLAHSFYVIHLKTFL